MASSSGQEVALEPHLIRQILSMASSTFIPFTRLRDSLKITSIHLQNLLFNFIAVQLYVNHAGTDTMCFIIHDKYPPMCYTRYMNIRSHSTQRITCKEKLRFPIICCKLEGTHSNGAIYIICIKRIQRGIHRYSNRLMLIFVHGVGDNVQDNRKCL